MKYRQSRYETNLPKQIYEAKRSKCCEATLH